MYFRCGDCLAATWLERPDPLRAQETVTCADCGRSYVAQPAPELGQKVGEHFRATVHLSNVCEIDMPGAYSVLLGILTLEQVRYLQDFTRADADDAVDLAVDSLVATEEKAPARGQLAPEMDPGFRKAIHDGCLTAQEALRRGDREVYARRLVERHGISQAQAYDVADNRVHLKNAVAARPAVRPAPRRVRRSKARVRRWQVLAACAASVLLLGWVGTMMWRSNLAPVRREARVVQSAVAPEPAAQAQATEAAIPAVREVAPSAAVKRQATQIDRDDSGRIVRIAGPDPATVLAAYCAGDVEGRLEPVTVTETVPDVPHARLGIFRDYRLPTEAYALRIRKDSGSTRWVAGDGAGPLKVVPAPLQRSAGRG